MGLSLSFPLQIRELPLDQHPRTRLSMHGPTSLSDAELLALLLGDQRDYDQTLKHAQHAIASTGSLHGLQRLSIEELQQLPGFTNTRAVRIKAALEMTRRLIIAGFDDRFQIRMPSDAAQLMMIEMGHLDQEHLRVICLDTKNRVQKIQTLYVGSLNSSLLRVGEVYKEAVRLNSAAIILVHNHPSGDPTPSADDIQVTRDVAAAGRLLDIDFLDHLIIGQGIWTSMRQHGTAFIEQRPDASHPGLPASR
jgi:DNA repair protein RadC